MGGKPYDPVFSSKARSDTRLRLRRESNEKDKNSIKPQETGSTTCNGTNLHINSRINYDVNPLATYFVQEFTSPHAG